MAMRLSLSKMIKQPASFILKSINNSSPLAIKQAISCYHNVTRSIVNNYPLHISPLVNACAPCVNIQCRHYGRKVKPKPQKITFFEYAGDLRTLPEINKEELLYPYVDFQDEFEGDEVNKKLASLEFASVEEKRKHNRQRIQDRIIELFGPDSELEQRIAKFTLIIRERVPYCIENRPDKFQKILLQKSIFHRRRLLTKLRDLDHERFEWLLRELKIRYVIPQDRPEWMGWKYNLQEATKTDTLTQKRQKLEEFKQKLSAERESFLERKAKILEEIDRDITKFGLSRDFLDDVQKKEVEKERPHKILTWEERVKLGMTDKIKDYYG